MKSWMSGSGVTYVRRLAIGGLVAILASASARAQVLYPVFVDANANGLNNGESWVNAYTSLDTAIANVIPGGPIWVKMGIYRPVSVSTGFSITKQMMIYGGFAGDEGSLGARHGSFVRTILEGDVTSTPSLTDNAWHVVSVQGVAGASGQPGVVIDGFQIRGGYAHSAPQGNRIGGGVWSNCSDLDIANCLVRSNFAFDGGGLYFAGGCGDGIEPYLFPRRLRIKSTEFRQNIVTLGGGASGGGGGAIFGDRLTGEIVNTQFLENWAFAGGGAVYLGRMGGANRLDFTNFVFWENFANGPGGGILLGDLAPGLEAKARVVNCTLADNFADGSGGPALWASGVAEAKVYNSICWWNTGIGNQPPIGGGINITVEYSDIEGGWVGGFGNVSGDPLFSDHNAGFLTLQLNPVSPCLDAADYSRLPTDNLDVDGDGDLGEIMPLDLARALRLVQQASVPDTGHGDQNHPSYTYLDMGAYERP